MIYKEYPIRVEGSTEQAKMTTYLISHSEAMHIQERPLIIICPGGGYRYVSDREGEMIAPQWNAYGYHAVVFALFCGTGNLSDGAHRTCYRHENGQGAQRGMACKGR